MPEDLLALFEKNIEREAPKINVTMALDLVQVFSRSGSTTTLELFDRIIGANIDDMSAQQIYDAFMAFATAEKAIVRPKITSLLMKVLSENLFNYSNDQLLRLC